MTNRTILITGAARGLGLELVKQHIGQHDQVFALVRNHKGPICELGEQPGLFVLKADVADTESVRQAFCQVRQETDKLDILYNNAAVFYEADKVPLKDTYIDRLSVMYNINSVGPLRVSQQALTLLRRGSLIVNISSEAASFGLCWRKAEYAYAMSKAALNMASLILSNELTDRGIRVLAIHPGWIKTDMGGPNATDDPTEHAAYLVDLACHVDRLPKDRIYVDHKGITMPW